MAGVETGVTAWLSVRLENNEYKIIASGGVSLQLTRMEIGFNIRGDINFMEHAIIVTPLYSTNNFTIPNMSKFDKFMVVYFVEASTGESSCAGFDLIVV